MKYPHVFSQSSLQTILAGLWAILSLLVFTPVYAGNAEEVFEQAAAYTVQIKTVTDIPFAGDSKSSSMGAGFVVDAKRGWVMTNAHVAARSPSQVRIKFRDGDYHEGKKLYVDPYLDLAILELNDDASINDVLSILDIPATHVQMVMVNGKPQPNRDIPLTAEDELTILAPVGGG